MRKCLIFLLAILSGTLNVSAREIQDILDSTQSKRHAFKHYRNSVVLSAADYYFRRQFEGLNVLSVTQDHKYGLYYNRAINRHFCVSAGYNVWNNMSWYTNTTSANHKFKIRPSIDTFKPGVILDFIDYKIADLSVSYIIDYFKKNKIKIGVGLSYTWGKNEVIDSIYTNPGPPYDGIIYQSSKNTSYWGVVPSVSYDYLLFKNRLDLGADVKYRRYFYSLLNTFEYGIHIGVNF